jgi:hypothetical protein
MYYKLFILISIVLLSIGCKNTSEDYLTSDEIIQLAEDLTPPQTALATVDRSEFDQTVEEVTHGLIFKYSGINEDSLNTTIAIPLIYSGTEFSISSSAQLICKKIQVCSGFCAVNRWLNCECIASANGNCVAINENHENPDISPGRILDTSLSHSPSSDFRIYP